MKFNVKNMVAETENSPVAKLFASWPSVVRLLAKRGFNRFEAEALLTSKLTQNGVLALRKWGSNKKLTSVDYAFWLDSLGLAPGKAAVNNAVMEVFGDELKLELNEDGVPCKRGTMPGAPGAGSVLVPLGTPRINDPTSELYWSA